MSDFVPRRAFTFVPLVLALAGALPVRAHAQGRAADPCAAELDAFACRRHHEQRALDAWPQRVRREGTKLMLRFDDGRALSLQDHVGPPGAATEMEKSISFLFREYLPAIGYYVVELAYAERGGFMLVNARNGRETLLDGEPVVAPGGRRLVEASQVSASGRGPREISVWRLDDDGPAREWTYSPPEGDAWDPVEPVWVNAVTVHFTRRVADPSQLSLHESPMLLWLTPGGWQMLPAR
jgi:hypothetical protein